MFNKTNGNHETCQITQTQQILCCREQNALVFDGQCKYGVIFGADFLSETGIDIKYSTGIIEWIDNKLPMCGQCQLDDKEYLVMAEILEFQCKAEHLFGMDWYDPTFYASEILDAKYGKVSTDDLVNQLTHLSDKKDMTLQYCLKTLPRYLMPHWVCTCTKSFTST